MKVVAHRGYCGACPENTMYSFKKAVEVGCDEIELDVQLTKDGKIVVIHDEVIDRVTDGTGYVRDYTFDEIRKFNAAKNFPNKTKFEPIPSFEEYCEWVKTAGVTTNIEIKTGVFYYEDIEQKTIEMIRKHGLEDRVMFSSFNFMSLYKAKQIAPKIPCGILVSERGLGNAGYFCKQFGFECYHPSVKSLNDTVVAECHKNGIKMNVWTIDQMGDLEKLYDWGCNGVITNFPGVCKRYIEGRK